MKNEERWKQRYYRQKSELKRLNRTLEQYSKMLTSSIQENIFERQKYIQFFYSDVAKCPNCGKQPFGAMLEKCWNKFSDIFKRKS